MAARREKFGLPPMIYGVAGYSIVRNTEAEAKAELARITDVKQSAAGYHNYQQWLAGTQLEQRVRSKTTRCRTAACGPGWSARRSRCSTGAGVRGRRRGPAAAAVQPAARGDGAIRGQVIRPTSVSGGRPVSIAMYHVHVRSVSSFLLSCRVTAVAGSASPLRESRTLALWFVYEPWLDLSSGISRTPAGRLEGVPLAEHSRHGLLGADR